MLEKKRKKKLWEKEKKSKTNKQTKNKTNKQTNKKENKREEEEEEKKKTAYSLPSLHERSETPGALDGRALHGSTALFHSSIVSTHLTTWCMHMYNVLY